MNDVQTPANTDSAPGGLPSFDFDDVTAAHERIKDRVVRTPTLKSITLSEIAEADVFLKFENLQFTAAYKERGALNALLLMDESKRKAGVIAASAGNHAQGLAYNARNLDIPATIVMPKTTPMVKVEQTRVTRQKLSCMAVLMMRPMPMHLNSPRPGD